MAKTLDPKIMRANPYKGVRRTPRYPKHTFQMRTRPFQIQPFCFVPVIPGETLKNAVLQSRVVSKPLKHPLVGWWCEYMLYYVTLRSIEHHVGTDFLSAMVTSPGTYNPATIRAAVGSAADAKYYHAAGGTNWLKAALGCVVEWYFRDQGEDWNSFVDDGMPLAQIKGKSWLDSLTLDENKSVRTDLDLDLNADGKLTVRELQQGMEHWAAMRDAGLAPADYEDWISTFGVAVPERQDESQEIYKPEELRYWSQWAYPVNTVDPATGVPSSAVSWINAFRADKDRLFKEPGFIVGVNVVRPKVYIKDTKGQLASFMESVENWLPAVTHREFEMGYKSFAANAGPLSEKIGASPYKAYWVDLRDLLMHGDQFMNYAPDDVSSAMSVITANGKHRYPTTATINDLFLGTTAETRRFDQDGVIDFAIMGRQRDQTSHGVPL